ncbi:response regulator receiver domain-containing protein [Mucilaginibacter frigoritolerans]|uniref:Response regulator receiver domain-containing protein n=1 Tax=Mucilaginibacter frigoritolerans TaxID=652788 RepID=A0A562TKX1_9SPHI|nr:response regulator [Mucilaginibacter frigoritolerans]TWI94205.1 response regulator receiver domain-containing protein [Mucilaginibacter frigoritolerans]
MLKRILVLDDSQVILDTIKEVLLYEKFEVKITKESKDIIETIKEYKPHLVILDYKNTGPKGDAICRQIKNNPTINDTPVIICSAYLNEDDMALCGCDATISKPFGIEELTDKVNNLVYL